MIVFMTAAEIAQWLDGELVGDGAVQISRVAKIDDAAPGDLTFLANPKYEKYLGTTKASAILVRRDLDPTKVQRVTPLSFIKVDDPYVAFLHVLKRITPPVDPFPAGIHPTAIVPESARLHQGVTVGAHVVIGKNVVVGKNTRISHGVVVGDGVTIGEECLIYPHVTIYHGCRLGHRVTIHAGSVIGSDGFGFAPKRDGTYEKIPQLGTVRIDDDVEIGAHCAIDRSTLGETVIGKGVKLDNLVHIAHNVTVGENTVIAAQTGIAGSVKVGKNVMVGGQVGISGHLEIADRTVILAQSGVTKSLTEPGKVYFGYPAKEQARAHRMEAALRMLPEMMREFRELQQRIEELLRRLTGEGRSSETSPAEKN
jgi:UDP-3-O-[3-hydroxymyristoyl] glucosamine N-acyltransferase